MEILVVIVDQLNKRKVIKTLNDAASYFKVSLNARGTADEAMLTYYGIEKSEKEVLMFFSDKFSANLILDRLDQKNIFEKSGAVAFTLPVNQVSQDSLDLLMKLGVIYDE